MFLVIVPSWLRFSRDLSLFYIDAIQALKFALTLLVYSYLAKKSIFAKHFYSHEHLYKLGIYKRNNTNVSLWMSKHSHSRSALGKPALHYHFQVHHPLQENWVSIKSSEPWSACPSAQVTLDQETLTPRPCAFIQNVISPLSPGIAFPQVILGFWWR